MTKDGGRLPQVRVRASRACRRCSQRKIKCDGAERGLPCCRCRSDRASDCAFVDSRRGTYSRNSSHKQSQDAAALREPQFPYESERSNLNADVSFHVQSLDGVSDYPADFSNAAGRCSNAPAINTQNDSSMQFTLQPVIGSASNSAITDPYFIESDTSQTRGSTTPGTRSQSSATSSLASMFEEFLNRQGSTNDGVVEKCGIIFLGGSSPLTFALEELRKGKLTNLHDVGVNLSKQSTSQEGIAGPEQNNHPAHLSPQEIAYLRSKGAFDFPKGDVIDSLVEAFLTRFYPLYSIVNKDEFVALCKEQKLPWILLHAVCFVGATFCDQGVIYKAGFKKRWHTRRLFYDKAKILFDIGYETNKIVLLQTVLMLTFWGPQMKSYWNPCSWVGFAVTIAESLGIHRLRASAHMNPKDKGLLRRLWWTLALRDASCAALLGRPFRINVAQCDTEILELDDFRYEISGCSSEFDIEAQTQAMYQIQIAKLSLILRSIIQSRYGPTESSIKTKELHAKLKMWQSELPDAVNWAKQHDPPTVFALSLKIVFHHHLILLYLDKPEQRLAGDERPGYSENASYEAARSAANTVSSTALTLMTKCIVSRMPHEIFPGFSIAGIVFYRQFQQQEALLAQLGRAALDNCQMVINEARDHWDAAQWMMRIFDFLLSSAQKTEMPSSGGQNTNAHTPVPITYTQGDAPGNLIANLSDTRLNANNGILHSIDWESPQFQEVSKTFDDFLLMQNFFAHRGDEPFDFQF